MLMTLEQSRWNPGLDDPERSLASIYQSMPGNLVGAIPWLVKLLENPKSPLAFPGAIDLFGHDCIHILLGRGLLPQDEAFVIGFTMGSSRCPRWQAAMFRWCAEQLYQGTFRFSHLDAE